MALVPCSTGCQAIYRRAEDVVPPEGEPVPPGGLWAVPVEAWDDAGKPYVAGRNGLVPAAEWRSNRFTFERLSGPLSWTGKPGKEPERFRVPDPDDPQPPTLGGLLARDARERAGGAR